MELLAIGDHAGLDRRRGSYAVTICRGSGRRLGRRCRPNEADAVVCIKPKVLAVGADPGVPLVEVGGRDPGLLGYIGTEAVAFFDKNEFVTIRHHASLSGLWGGDTVAGGGGGAGRCRRRRSRWLY